MGRAVDDGDRSLARAAFDADRTDEIPIREAMPPLNNGDRRLLRLAVGVHNGFAARATPSADKPLATAESTRLLAHGWVIHREIVSSSVALAAAPGGASSVPAHSKP